MEENVPVLYPLTEKDSVKPIRNWGYLLWRDIYVSPVVENVTSMTVTFPKDDVWVDYWDHNVTYNGGTSVDYSVPLDRFPIFLRAGSMIPLHVHDSISVFGDERFSDFLTFYVAFPSKSGGYQQVRRWKSISQEVWYTLEDSKILEVTSSASHYDLLFVFVGLDQVPQSVTERREIQREVCIGSLVGSHDSGWTWVDNKLYLRLVPSHMNGHSVKVSFI